VSGVIVAGGGWRDFAMTRGKTNPEVRMPDEKDGTNAKAGHNPNVDPLPIGMTVKYVMKYWPHGTHHQYRYRHVIQLASQLPKSLRGEGNDEGVPYGSLGRGGGNLKLMHENQ